MRILVTGATGFVGQCVCPALLAADHEVLAAMRTAAPGAPPAEIRQHVIGNIGATTPWEQALEECEAVVHLAAYAHRPGERESPKYFEVNAQGTRRLAQCAARAGVRHFVYVSTIKVHGEGGREPVTEDSAFDPQDDYARSKREGEIALEQAAAASAMKFTILRPPLVYGPRVKANFLALLRAVERGFPIPASAANRRSVLYVENLANAVVRCLADSRAAGMAFVLSDGEPLSTARLVELIAASLGRPPRILTLPNPVVTFAATLLGRRDALARLSGSLYLDDSGIRTKLEWMPPHSTQTGLARTAEWFRSIWT